MLKLDDQIITPTLSVQGGAMSEKPPEPSTADPETTTVYFVYDLDDPLCTFVNKRQMVRRSTEFLYLVSGDGGVDRFAAESSRYSVFFDEAEMNAAIESSFQNAVAQAEDRLVRLKKLKQDIVQV